MTYRYDTSGYTEDQYEPGSDGTVLKNLLGVTSREEMAILETEELWRTQEYLLGVIEEDQCFTARDIFEMHRIWLSRVYEWAGKTRRVNVSKGEVVFAMAHTIPDLMLEFERNQLSRYTPCRFDVDPSFSRGQRQTWPFAGHANGFAGWFTVT